MIGGIEIPDNWLGKPLDGALERILQGKPKERKRAAPTTKTQSRVFQPATNIDDPENWVILEGRKHGNFSYPDLVVSMHRLGYSPLVEQAALSLGYNLADTATEKDGTAYIGNIDWKEAIKLNLTLGNFTLNPRQGMDLLLDLRNATKTKGAKKLYDADGKEIDPQRLKSMYNEIRQVRDPWRGEHLDAKFMETRGTMNIYHGFEFHKQNGIMAKHMEPLAPCLDGGVTFSLDGLNNQGLPTKADSKSSFYFYKPGNGTVARFCADSVWADLGCIGGPSNRNAGLGVRAARVKI